ncbi:DEAD-box ATP-dependent RNA helicase 41 [Dioscorea cayenensis subsp. rotundata]|uniref:RNA helicase n=1 Tax=Dioscorea cayennensis subsp. rotundata TaxID=55577 RepID=A0AB40D0W6_DIOCR|nr:DEAD-box ATP-dependent RNA helicase 41 [Dioscorea cayenensis subsp. rotundata]
MEETKTQGEDHNLPLCDVEDCPVKEKCCDQREALPGEPRCVICGRFGEYICDETDDDVCSRECKQTLISRLAESQKPAAKAIHSVQLPATDECCYVRDGGGSSFQYLNTDKIESLRSKINIVVKGETVPAPLLSFSSCDLPKKLQENLEAAGYEIPTPVQMQTIPAALTRRNLLVSADTGSGKTVSFLVPIVSHCTYTRLQHLADKKWPLAMVLAPTRELCVQVEDQAKALGKGLPFKTALIVGGAAMASQVYRLEQGVEMIVGTPGRLIDLLSKHDIELNQVSVLVLDEVDCMLQKGFRDQVMQIFQALSHPQVLMFSATISKEVEKMANSLTENLIYVSAGKPRAPSEAVKQVVIWVESKQKKQKLFAILTSKQHFRPPVVVFVSSRLGADLLSEAITCATGLVALSIHGEKCMKERRESLGRFLTGDVSVIVATGVLGRGVDLLKVRQVIIFDMPNSMEEYIHQIGRASRMGEEGSAIVFINEEDKKLFKELVQNLKSVGAAIPRELANSHYLASNYPVSSKQKRRKYGS